MHTRVCESKQAKALMYCQQQKKTFSAACLCTTSKTTIKCTNNMKKKMYKTVE
jgi:hypothetical protein